MTQRRRFFSGTNLDQALTKASRAFGVSVDDLEYRQIDKKHGFTKAVRNVVIEASAGEPLARPSSNDEAPAPRPEPKRPEPERAEPERPEPAAPEPEAPRLDEEPPPRLVEESRAVEPGWPEDDEPAPEPSREDSRVEETAAPAGEERSSRGASRGARRRSRSRGSRRDERPESPRESAPEPRRESPREAPREAAPPREPEEPRREMDDRPPRDVPKVEKAVYEALDYLLDLAALDVEGKVDGRGEFVEIELRGRDRGVLIEDDGRLLMAIQHLLPRILWGLTGEGAPCRVDSEGFRDLREARLRDIARQTADEVRRERRPQQLQPLSPDARRIVHLELAEDDEVETVSHGGGFYKRVTVRPMRSGGGRREHRSRR